MRHTPVISLLFLTMIVTVVPPATAIRYLTKEEALNIAIPDAQRFQVEEIQLTPDQQKRVQDKVDEPIETDTFIFHVGKHNNQVDGYAYITDKKGRHRPITFIVGLKADCTVQDVAIMIYREPRGYEVKEKRFLRQYRHKAIDDPIEVHRDIKNISGATISAESVSAGVREAVAICEEVFSP
jgi:Na+-translocating ferredoxin:NAD+ oxidoreductase RnfG subunit